MSMLKKLKEKKEPKMMDSIEKESKLGILQDLMSQADEMMGEKLKTGLKKVTVAAPTSEGLKKGLEKAEEIVEAKEEPEAEEAEEYEEESEEMSEEELQKQIDELMKKKEELAKKKM